MAFTDREIKEQYTKLRDNIVVARNQTKDSFDRFRTNLKEGLDPKYYEQLGIDIEHLTAEEWLPHLFSEPFDGEAYEVERQKAEAKFQELRMFKENLKEKAAEAMGMK